VLSHISCLFGGRRIHKWQVRISYDYVHDQLHFHNLEYDIYSHTYGPNPPGVSPCDMITTLLGKFRSNMPACETHLCIDLGLKLLSNLLGSPLVQELGPTVFEMKGT
jgi:hypothetical protein